MFEHVAENPKHLPGSRILDPAIGSDSANALLPSQDEKVGGCRIQMARVVIHESPLLFARYRHARVHPAQRSESAVVYFTRSLLATRSAGRKRRSVRLLHNLTFSRDGPHHRRRVALVERLLVVSFQLVPPLVQGDRGQRQVMPSRLNELTGGTPYEHARDVAGILADKNLVVHSADITGQRPMPVFEAEEM